MTDAIIGENRRTFDHRETLTMWEKLTDGPVRTRAFWVFLVGELVAIAGTVGIAPELVGQAESIAMHVLNVVFYSAVMFGTAGTMPMTKLEQDADGVYRERL